MKDKTKLRYWITWTTKLMWLCVLGTWMAAYDQLTYAALAVAVISTWIDWYSWREYMKFKRVD